MSAVLDQKVAAAEERMLAANHISGSYGKRASQLRNWKRTLDFISLGVAPGILLVVVDKPYFREAGLVLAGLCSSAAYVWAVFTYTFEWARQLEVSQDATTRAHQISQQLKDVLGEIRARSTEEDGNPYELIPSVEKLIGQYERMYAEINGAGIAIKPWMTLISQQETMLETKSLCGECGNHWDTTKHRMFSANEAKRFLKTRESNYPDNCGTCGLPRNNNK